MAFLDLFKRKPSKEILHLEMAQAELALVRSQLNPDFLCNTLNHIYAMAYPFSDDVAEALTKLSVLMRYMLTKNADTPVELNKEVECLHHFISLQRLRFRNDFFADLKINGDSASIQIAPLILLSLIENAFKYGITNNEKRPVKINVQTVANRLSFTVSYKIDHSRKGFAEDTDVADIRRRLEKLYAGNYDLMIANNGETYKSTLNIKLI